MGSERFNLVLERALIHHINDIQACFNEAYRVLQENGIYIIQDRTPDDCLLAGNDYHIRGYIFERCPRLAEKEKNRRYNLVKMKCSTNRSYQVITVYKNVTKSFPSHIFIDL